MSERRSSKAPLLRPKRTLIIPPRATRMQRAHAARACSSRGKGDEEKKATREEGDSGSSCRLAT